MLSPSYFDFTERSLELRSRRPTRRRSSMCGGARHTTQSPHLLPGALWRDAGSGRGNGRPNSDVTRPIVVACKAGHEMSQTRGRAIARRRLSTRACWKAATKAGRRPACRSSRKPELDRIAPQRPSLWVTRRRPKIDRIACPWLIRRFLDPQARILFVDPDQVTNVARETGAIPFDIEDVETQPRGRALHVRHHAQAVRAGRRAVAGAAGADRARRRHRAARSRAGSGRTACRFRSGFRRWPATTTTACSSAASWSTMRCSPGCALRPRSGTTGRPRRREMT